MRHRDKTMWQRAAVLVVLLLVTACTFPLPDPAGVDRQGAEPERNAPVPVSIAIGAPSTPVYLNFDLAQALGYFAAEGLAVDLQHMDGGSDAAAALKSGAVDFSGNAMDHVLAAQRDGDSLRMLMNFLDHACATLIVRADLADEIQHPADLRGRTVGVTRMGSATHILTVYVAAKAGVPAADFQVVEVGAAAMPEAIASATVEVAMGVAPYTTRVVEAGTATVLVDLCQPQQSQLAIGGGLPFTGLLTRADVIDSQPEVVQRVVNALVQAQQYIMTHSVQEIVATLPPEATGDDVAAYTEALEATLPAFSRNGGVVDPTGLQTLLTLHEAFGTITDPAQVDLDALYDNQFVLAAQKEREPLAVAGIYGTALEEPWNQVTHQALLAAEAQGEIQYTAIDEAGFGDDIGAVIRAAIAEEAPAILFGDAFGSEEIVGAIAQEHPEIAFVFGSDEAPRLPNLSVFDSWTHEPAYLAGMLAGGMTESDLIGVVAGFPEVSVNRVVNAFIAGAQAANPDVTVLTEFINSWYDPRATGDAARAQIQAGADVIFGERTGVIEAAAAQDVYAIGNMVDQHALAPEHVLTSVVWDMTPAIVHVLATVRRGDYQAQDLAIFSTLARGGARLAPIAPGIREQIAPELLALVETRQVEIMQGQFQVSVDDNEPPGTTSAIVLGTLYNLTGAQAALDIPSSRGARLAVQEANQAGGVRGQPLHLAIADGESNPAVVQQQTTSILEQYPQVAGFLGLSDTDMVLAAAPVATAHGRLFLTSGATSPRLPEQTPGIFLACFGDNVQAAAAAEWAYTEQAARTAAILYDSESTYTHLLQGYFGVRFSELGGQIVAREQYQPGASEGMRTAVDRLPEADILFVAAGPADAPEAARLLRAAGFTAPILGGDGFDSGALWQQYAELENIFFTTHAYLGADNPDPQVQAFRTAYRALYPDSTPDAFAALGYDAARLLIQALGSAGSADPGALTAALATIQEFAGITGTISFTPGNPIPTKAVTILEVHAGSYRFHTQVTPQRVPAPDVVAQVSGDG